MPKEKREKDRASGTGRTDSDKKGGAGSFAWGRADDSTKAALAPADPNNASGAFRDALGARLQHKYIDQKDLSNPLFFEGVLVALKARQSTKPCGLWIATTIGLTEAFDEAGNSLKGSAFDADFRAAAGPGFSNVDGFLAKQGIGDGVGTVFVAAESESVGTTLAIEAILAAGGQVLDVGILDRSSLGDCVANYNESPFTDKAGFLAATEAKATVANPLATRGDTGAVENKSENPPPGFGAAPAAGGEPTAEERAAMKKQRQIDEDEKTYKSCVVSAARLNKAPYTVWDNDSSLGAKAPSLENLVWKRGAAPYNYGDKPITVVGFWGKFAKGDYTTLNSWNHIQRRYNKEGAGVQFIGISRDPKEADCDKFIERLGSFLRELGERGITTCCEYPLAYDPDRAVGAQFQTLSSLMSLAVGMCYVIDAEGVIRWREQFTRGGSPMNQLEAKIDELVRTGSITYDNGDEPEEEEEDDTPQEGESTTVREVKPLQAPGAADY
jgi:hypothetical protein